MRRKSHATDLSSEEVVKDIRRATRKRYSAEEKIASRSEPCTTSSSSLTTVLRAISASSMTTNFQRFETQCENWRTLAEAERARRKSLPGPTAGTE